MNNISHNAVLPLMKALFMVILFRSKGLCRRSWFFIFIYSIGDLWEPLWLYQLFVLRLLMKFFDEFLREFKFRIGSARTHTDWGCSANNRKSLLVGVLCWYLADWTNLILNGLLWNRVVILIAWSNAHLRFFLILHNSHNSVPFTLSLCTFLFFLNVTCMLSADQINQLLSLVITWVILRWLLLRIIIVFILLRFMGFVVVMMVFLVVVFVRPFFLGSRVVSLL